MVVLSACRACANRHKSLLRKAEGKGLEPSTPCGATDFESLEWWQIGAGWVNYRRFSWLAAA